MAEADPRFLPLTHWWIRGIAGGIRNLKHIQDVGIALTEQDAMDLVFLAQRLNEMVGKHLGHDIVDTPPPRSYL